MFLVIKRINDTRENDKLVHLAVFSKKKTAEMYIQLVCKSHDATYHIVKTDTVFLN